MLTNTSSSYQCPNICVNVRVTDCTWQSTQSLWLSSRVDTWSLQNGRTIMHRNQREGLLFKTISTLMENLKNQLQSHPTPCYFYCCSFRTISQVSPISGKLIYTCTSCSKYTDSISAFCKSGAFANCLEGYSSDVGLLSCHGYCQGPISVPEQPDEHWFTWFACAGAARRCDNQQKHHFPWEVARSAPQTC